MLDRGGQLSQLLADSAHFLTVGDITGEQTNLLAHRRTAASSCGRLLQSGPHGLRVVQAFRPNDVQRGRARVVQPYVQRASHNHTVARIVLHNSGSRSSQ